MRDDMNMVNDELGRDNTANYDHKLSHLAYKYIIISTHHRRARPHSLCIILSIEQFHKKQLSLLM